MKVLIIFSVFLLAQVYGNVINAKCDQQLFSKCTDTFAKALGLPSMPTDANVLEQQIKTLEAKGKQGQNQVCTAAGNLQTCLGQEYKDCISVAFLKSIGESDEDAKKFVAISHHLEKQCVQTNLNAVDDKCDAITFGICINMFALALDLPYMPTDPSLLDKQIKQLEAKGKQGQTQVCNALSNLQACLASEYTDCISVASFKSMGESDEDATKFVAIFQQLVHQCFQIQMNAINAKCDQQLFTKCTDTFAKALGLPSMPTDANVLEQQIKTLEAKGKQGQTQVCTAAGNLQTCLGQEYHDCISVAFLKSIGESDADAKKFVAISHHLEKQCVQTNLNAVDDKCDARTYGVCTTIFAWALGLPAMPTDPSLLDKQIKELEAKGKQGQTQVCNGLSYLHSCMGNKYSDCISVAYFKSIGISDTNATEFFTIFQQLAQQCSQIQMNAVNEKCDQQLFSSCTDKFAKALGLSAMPSDSRVLLLQVMQVEAKGQQGVMQVCKAEADLQTCLGQEYNDCLSVAFLKSIGESDADAQAFVGLSDLLKKTCVH